LQRWKEIPQIKAYRASNRFKEQPINGASASFSPMKFDD